MDTEIAYVAVEIIISEQRNIMMQAFLMDYFSFLVYPTTWLVGLLAFWLVGVFCVVVIRI